MDTLPTKPPEHEYLQTILDEANVGPIDIAWLLLDIQRNCKELLSRSPEDIVRYAKTRNTMFHAHHVEPYGEHD
jgi:hypothetical protein